MMKTLSLPAPDGQPNPGLLEVMAAVNSSAHELELVEITSPMRAWLRTHGHPIYDTIPTEPWARTVSFLRHCLDEYYGAIVAR